MNNDFVFMFLIAIIALVMLWQYNAPIKERDGKDEKDEIPVQQPYPVQQPIFVSQPVATVRSVDVIGKRDEAVISDSLYPPIDRMPRPLADEYLRHKLNGTFGYSTRDNADTYRMVGYLINSVDRADKWNIFGRQKYRGSNQGEYYAIQQCNSHGPCTKIVLCDDIITTNKLRDYYNLPSTITFNSPLFATTPYDVVQLKTTIDYSPYF